MEPECAVELISTESRQFYDLLEIFRIGGKAPDTNYLFLGKLATKWHGAPSFDS